MKNLLLTSAIACAALLSCAPVATAQQLSSDQFTKAAESTVNGVVSIKTFASPRQQYYGGNDFFDDPFFDFFFNRGRGQRQQPNRSQQPKELQQLGLGSGVILSTDGYIVTNNHVIDGAERIDVTLNDNRQYTAELIGRDPLYDLALIKIEADELHAIPMGDSDKLKVGEWVLAVGNPFGFTSSVTSGIVSAKARNISSSTGNGGGGIESYIQTDAAVNRGNSGGALVNLNGQLVGINTAIYSQNGAYVGCSFAIPTSIVSKVVNDFKQYGAVQRGLLGITASDVTPELIKQKNIKGTNVGIYIVEVSDRSAAKEGGLQEGDVIIAMQNMPIRNMAQLQDVVARFSPGDKVTLTYIRDGEKHTATVTMRNQQGETSITKNESVASLGCAFAKLTKEQMQRLEISNGVQVKGLEDGYMKSAGVPDNFIILTINGQRVNQPSDVERIFNAVMQDADADKVLILKGITSAGKQAYYAVTLGE